MPPGQSVMTKYWKLRSCLDAYMMTDEPLGANPYLCVSHEIEVTPGTRKSTGAIGKLQREKSKRRGKAGGVGKGRRRGQGHGEVSRSQLHPRPQTHPPKLKTQRTYPAFSMKGTMKPPRQQSTCRPMLLRRAILASAWMSSMAPCGKLGAEPTI